MDRYIVKKSDILLALTAVFLLFWALGDRGLWTSEGRWAEVTREMFITRDFFHPTINGVPYFDKPLLTYWLVALTSPFTRGLNEWTIRIPSAISGILAIWATVSIGRRLWSARVGTTAGWILLTTYGFLFWARTGTADMENLAATTLALAWYWSKRDRPKFSSFFVFYLIAFIGSLTKGLTALVVPILLVLPDVFTGGRWKKVLRPSHLLAFILAASIYLVPFIYASITRSGYQENGLAMVFHENIQRYLEPFDHRGPFYCYLYYIPILFLPWTPLFLLGCAGTLRQWKELDSNTKWLIEASLIVFLFFSVSGSRRSYYILPIIPLCALWTAVFLERDIAIRRWAIRIQLGLLACLALLELMSPLIWPVLERYIGFVAPYGLKTATMASGVAVFGLLMISLWRIGMVSVIIGISRSAVPLVISTLIIMGTFFCCQAETLGTYRTERPFAMKLKARLAGTCPEQVAFFHKISTNVIFYLDFPGPVRLLLDQDAVRRFTEDRPVGKVLISRRKYLPKLTSILPASMLERPDLTEDIYPWEKASKKLVAWELKTTNK